MEAVWAGVVGGEVCGKRGARELVFEDEDAAGEGDYDDVRGEEDAGPEMDLEERAAEEELARIVDGVVEHGGVSRALLETI